MAHGLPAKHGLYDPANEKESCGVGFVAHIKGQRSHDIIVDAANMLECMDHRGAYGCEPNTGDGAGILTALPHAFIARLAHEELRTELPPEGRFSAGVIFLPTEPNQRERCKKAVDAIIVEEGQQSVGWRKVPVDPKGANLGPTALKSQPHIEQLFVAAAPDVEGDAFERKLYTIRKRATHLLRNDASMSQAKMFYICSLSTKVIIYKGMLAPYQVTRFYPDLLHPLYKSHLAMVHSRFSTNTFPSWDRAQPNRFMSHNGEINTLRGNLNWMHAREGVFESPLFGDDLKKLYPIAEPDLSDSGNFDNVLEFLLMTGRTLQESVMMMVPEAWENHPLMSTAKRDFYEYHSCLMEPWDGPASIAFTDGKYIGAVLDRNGLRPSRYYLTHDDRVIMASEVGVVDVDPENVQYKGRLEPGRMFLVDFEEGRLIPDEELKDEFATRRPYGKWLDNHKIEISNLPGPKVIPAFDGASLINRLRAFGYTTETISFMLIPMLIQQRDPVGSMGNDAALACLSDKPRMVYDYFRQLFAQVTNPPIDSIREEVIMSLDCFIGPERNLLETTKEHCGRLHLPHPILTNREFQSIKQMNYQGWQTKTIDITWPRHEGTRGMVSALDRICMEAEEAIDDGYSVVVLSDRNIGPDRVPISSLAACGAVHHHLIRAVKRTQIGLIVETGEAREVHQHCLLVGFGADAINPYLAFEAVWQAYLDDMLPGEEYGQQHNVEQKYRKAVAKGMLKVMAKMGISTLRSYKGAQIFEAVGLAEDVIERCFTGAASRIQGVSLEVLAEESLRRHRLGYPKRQAAEPMVLDNDGQFHERADGEKHMWDSKAIASLQVASRTNNSDAYWEFADHVNKETTRNCELRGLLKFKKRETAIPLLEVEPAENIVKRFVTGAMSFGSISAESHETLAVAMNRLGGKSNTGEGGEDPARFQPLGNGDSKRSAIKQVASGRFGVTIWYLAFAVVFQIMMAQGAKPGEGGELPGGKVDEYIAHIRHSTPGVGLISPPPHHDIYSIEDLKQLIQDLKHANPDARISVKLVSEVGVGTVAAGVAKAYADHILVSGAGGGTGASPLTSIKHAGLPWELGVAETHQTLVLNDLRSRVVLQTDGQLKTGRDVIIAALLGAEEFGFATAPLITLGCIMMRKCHLNTCPVGIATQDLDLRRKFTGKPDHVVNYLFMVAEEARRVKAKLGHRRIAEANGRLDLLEVDDAITHWKAEGLDLTPMLTPARKPHPDVEVRCTQSQNHHLEEALDRHLIARSSYALRTGEAIRFSSPIRNTDRVVGAMLSHRVVRQWGGNMMEDDTIHIDLKGSAGQSFGAWLASGLTLELAGDANDYVGKGLSGGKLVIYPPKGSNFRAEDNILVGNVCLYGATSGTAFFRGRAAERFAVRNSGARAVVEGVGDHGCEYMTGGRVVVLGTTGRNFAAGMSGGISYVWDRDGKFSERCNQSTVELEPVEVVGDAKEVHGLITLHHRHTDSAIARYILTNWKSCVKQFIRVMPTDYKRVLNSRKDRSAKTTPSNEEVSANG